MKRYAIWNKQDPIITPIGEVLTAEQWIDRYPVAGLDSVSVVCAAGEINGGFFGTLAQMVDMYTNQGCDFSACTTDEEKLETLEAFDEAKKAEAEAAAKQKAEEEALNAELSATSMASIAAQLEYQNMMTLDDSENSGVATMSLDGEATTIDPWVEKIAYNYEAGLWNKPMVRKAVKKGILTVQQCEEILQEAY